MINFIKKLFGNPYDAYLNLDYEKLSEKEMMNALHGVFDIDPSTKKGLFDEVKHYKVVERIIMTSIKLKYTSVCDQLRRIYPLSFPMWEKSYPKTPHEVEEERRKENGVQDMAQPEMIQMPFNEQDKRRKGIDYDYLRELVRNKTKQAIRITKLICCSDGIVGCRFCNTPSGYTFIVCAKNVGIVTKKRHDYQFYICQKCALGKK